MVDKPPEEQVPPAAGPKGRASPFQDFAQATSRVVQQAASILEEEIAAGIIAAKRVEDRFVNVEQLRSGKPDEVMQRLRRDAHDVLDIFVDMVHVAVREAQNLVQRVVSIRTTPDGDKRPDRAAAVPSLTLPHPLAPGQSGEVPLSLENDSDAPTAEFSLRCSDLMSATGARIPMNHVSFEPGSLVIPPHQSTQVVVAVAVPAGATPGLYTGLVVAAKLDHLRAVLMVQVD
jgi:hypothetical protein